MTQYCVLAMCIRRLPTGCLFDLLRCIFNVVWCRDLNHSTGIIKALGIFSSVWLLHGFLYISSIISRCQLSVRRTRRCLIGNHQTMQNLPFSLPQRTLCPCHLYLFQNNFTQAFFSHDTAHRSPQQNSFLHEKHQWTFFSASWPHTPANQESLHNNDKSPTLTCGVNKENRPWFDYPGSL